METLADDDEERYKSQFQKYLDDGIEGLPTCPACFYNLALTLPTADGLEELYSEAHAKIREDPNLEDPDKDEKKPKEYWKAESQKYRLKKISREERRANVEKKIKELQG